MLIVQIWGLRQRSTKGISTLATPVEPCSFSALSRGLAMDQSHFWKGSGSSPLQSDYYEKGLGNGESEL